MMISYLKIFLYCSLIYLSFSGKSDAGSPACSIREDVKKLSFPIVIFHDSLFQNTDCRAHIISPYLVLTAASCFNDLSPQNYSIHLNQEASDDDPIELSELIKITKIHYSNSESKNDGYLALAELENEIPFNDMCIDWQRYFENNLKNFIHGGWTLGSVIDESSNKAIDKKVYGYTVSCENSAFSSTTDLSGNYDCFRVDNGFVTKKGVGFYITYGFNYYLKGIAIETSPEPSNTALFTSLTKYLDWMKSVINESNRDHNNYVVVVPDRRIGDWRSMYRTYPQKRTLSHV